MNSLIAYLLLVIHFFVGWIVSIRSRKLCWVDFFWASGFLLVPWILVLEYSLTTTSRLITVKEPQTFLQNIAALGTALSASLASTNGTFWVLALMVSIWSTRLSLHLFRRIKGGDEDPRYLKLREHWGTDHHWKTFLLYFCQGLLVVFLSRPLTLSFQSQDQNWSWSHSLGILVFTLAWLGEVIADQQLFIFKKRQRVLLESSEICDIGLWRYSRHPNYFFEILIWLSYGIYCLTIPNGGWALLPFLMMSFLIVFVTGVAPAERTAVERKGDRWRAYQKRTSMLIPWPPKEN